jgi:ribosomal protein S12 methylthiotransferase
MKIGVVSLGCPKNLVDTEVMLGLTERAGHTLTSNPAEADVLLVNTCAFIEAARRESIDAILEMAEYKKRGPGRRLVVTGCLAERYRTELQAQIPEIDAILGTGQVPEIVSAIDGQRRGGQPPLLQIRRRSDAGRGAAATTGNAAEAFPSAVCEPVAAQTALPTYLYDGDTPRVLTTPGHLAYVKVAEGCDYACSFCIIPRLRGAYRSRTVGSVVQEARTLVARGVREIVLVSQDTTFFGVDRGERGALGRLVRELNEIPDLRWIRLLYLYPTTIGGDTLDAVAECDKVCKYIDLPLQHASNRVLRRMRRPGTRSSYERLLGRIRGRIPGVALRTTFIVGFPGETAEDFWELCEFVRQVGFDHVGVFIYSDEEGTAAHQLGDDVPTRVKRQRRGQLMALQKRLVARANRGRVGETVQVMVDGPSPDHALVLKGRLQSQAPEIDPVVYLTEADPTTLRPGDLVRATIVGARGYDLVARPLP